ncbi:hypothetical protein ABZV67_10655 [Streptomyces sp. NPDC005065]|uniref:hypothetical protein n=1 Tax=Streptomyces sp. NPDC005065 TaxID=3154461 RepID=UPI0033A429AE
MTTPTAMPGARLTVAGTVSKLITDLADIADDGRSIDLDTVDTIAALTSAYAALVAAQHDRKAAR